MRQEPIIIIFQRELEKLPTFPLIGTVSRFCLEADFWGTNLQDGHPTREPDKAFRNPALCGAAIQGLPASRGLCSSRVIGVLLPRLPATSLSLCAAFSPARRSNSLGCPSPGRTLMQIRLKSVFTRTQPRRRFNKFPLVFLKEEFRNVPGMNPKATDAGNSSLEAQTEWPSKSVHQIARERCKRHFHSTPDESRVKKSSSIRGILSLGGQSSFGSTRNALARQSSSKSETQRSCVSIFASVCRLKSHPHRRQRAASIGCVNPCWSRNRRICNPTRFRGFFVMFRFPNRNSRRNAISKGSEFRTPISLAFSEFFSDFRGDDNFFHQMNFLLKETEEYTVLLHIRHSSTSETFNTQ